MKLDHTQAREATLERGGTVLLSNTNGFPFKRGRSTLRGKLVPALLLAFGGAFVFAGHAMAQATSPTGGLGAQLNTMSSEAINSGGEGFGMACYLAAAVCFGLYQVSMTSTYAPSRAIQGS